MFREVVDEIAMLMAYEVSRDMPLEDVVIETPIEESTQKHLVVKSSNRTDSTGRTRHGRRYSRVDPSG